MRLATKLTAIALSLSLVACGSEEKTSGGGAASSATLFSVNNNICSLLTPKGNFTSELLAALDAAALAEGGAAFEDGVCPNTVTVETTKATVVRTCQTVKKTEGSSEYSVRTSIYSTKKTDAGLVTVSDEQAAEICQALEAG